jgi:hypothetical protein
VLVPVQAMQAAPPVPHAPLLSLPTAMQVLPLQHPAQLPALHVGWHEPLWQVSVPVQAAHVTPPLPHCEFDSLPTATQALPLQQPAQLPGPQLPAQTPL